MSPRNLASHSQLGALNLKCSMPKNKNGKLDKNDHSLIRPKNKIVYDNHFFYKRQTVWVYSTLSGTVVIKRPLATHLVHHQQKEQKIYPILFRISHVKWKSGKSHQCKCQSITLLHILNSKLYNHSVQFLKIRGTNWHCNSIKKLPHAI